MPLRTTPVTQRAQHAMALVMAADDTAARELLAMCGGNQRMVLTTRIRLAAIVAREPDALNPRRALALVDRAIALADVEGMWHPVFGDVDPATVARDTAL